MDTNGVSDPPKEGNLNDIEDTVEDTYSIPSTSSMKMDTNGVSDPPKEGNLNDIEDTVEDTYSIPSTSSIINDQQLGFEDEEMLELSRIQGETPKNGEPSTDNFIDCDEWQDLGKSDYAKVIFCDLYYEPASGNVGCKFEITDSVHEDPCDYIGLFHIGFENLNECLVFKSLSETNCEDDGKLQRCDFKYEELPELDMGFYQFLYITHDKEICGASMPFEIKPERSSLSPDSVIVEKVDEDDFLLVCRGLGKKYEQLLQQMSDQGQNDAMVTSNTDRSASDSDKMSMVESFKNTIESLKTKLAKETAQVNHLKESMNAMADENKFIKEQLENNSVITIRERTIEELYRVNEILVKSIDESAEKAEALVQQNISLKADNEQLKQQVLKLEKKNAYFENELDHFRKMGSDTSSDEVMDLKIMIKALEQGKELATKEISSLSKKLACAVEVMRMHKLEVKMYQDAMQQMTIEKPIAEVQNLMAELTYCEESLKESRNSETEAKELNLQLQKELSDLTLKLEKQKTENLEAKELNLRLQKELSDCRKELENQYAENVEAKKCIFKLKRELSDCTDHNLKLQKQSAERLKLKESAKEIMEAICKAESEVSSLYYSVISWKPVSQDNTFRTKKCAVISKCGIIKDNLSIIREKCQEKLDFSEECSIIDQQREQMKVLQAQLSEKEAGNRELQIKISDVTRECCKLKEEKCDLETKFESVAKQLHDKNECYQKLEKEMSDLSQECSNLEENIKECNANCISFENDLLNKEAELKNVVGEIALKDDLIKSLEKEKEEEIQRLMKKLTDCEESLKQYQSSEIKDNLSSSKEKELQELVNDHVSRLTEAAKLYRKQYKEIEKLKKKLTKSKKESQTPSSVPTESTASSTSVISDVAEETAGCHNTPISVVSNPHFLGHFSYPGKVLSRKSSDSDTGEHVSEDGPLFSTQKTPVKIIRGTAPRSNSTSERSALYKALLTNRKKQESSVEKSALPTDENPNLIKDTNQSQIGDPLCGALGTSRSSLLPKKEPGSKFCSVSTCPYCGITFRKYMPKVFLAHHITKHVFKYVKPASEKPNSCSESSLDGVTCIPEMMTSNEQSTGEAKSEKMYSIPCPICKEVFYVSCKTTEALSKHLGEQHDSMMCHCCGILFDKSTPGIFVADHMLKHFKPE